MAKTMWMRPNVVALCAFQAHFFSTRAILPWFPETKPARRVLTSSEKISWTRCGGYGGSKLDSRWSHSIRATTQVNDSGSIDSPLIQSMEKKIKEHLNADSVLVKDAYGDGRHVSIDVISSAFEGQSAVSRQRMVYKAIWEELQNTVHAVDQMTTRTPAEVASAK
ncbi:protein BOLA4, chloroplastic/mitochondrial-like [Actinidia eriantha]|uniref:protein BOLA4, chloroplastic/mitochondrial-like n=1 Tax=Actinidia eriantha TaxID=165200 RepID=UPI00259117A1|nr:protein BOLA4, chloroplastic/mitochondrial-like [Actinidia eriantha]